jgi:hypothetical protein
MGGAVRTSVTLLVQDIGNTFWFEGNTFLDCFLDFI